MNHPAWTALQQGLANMVSQNLPEWIIFGSALAIAFVCTWPELIPKSAQDWWSWFRNAFQTAVPAARARHEASSSVTTTTPTSSTKQEATASTAVDPTQPKAGA